MASGELSFISSGTFSESFSKYLREVERRTLQEVGRLNEALAAARAENELLEGRLLDASIRCVEGHPRNVKGPSLESNDAAAGPDQHAAQAAAAAALPSERSLLNVPCDEINGRKCNVVEAPSSEGSQAAVDPNQGIASVARAPTLSSGGSFLNLPGDEGSTRQSHSRVRQILATDKRRGTKSQRYQNETGIAQEIVKSPWFEHGSLCFVVLNAVWISVDLDLNGTSLLDSPVGFQLIEHFFVAVFTLEMVVRFMAIKGKRNALFDLWFLFDSLLVILMIIEDWVISIIFLILDTSHLESFAFISLLRIIRLLRTTRLVRLCHFVPELKTMIQGLLAGIRSVMITAVLLFVLTYTFAIFLRQLGDSTSWGQESFNSVPLAVYTLLVESMLPDNAELLEKIGSETWYCGVLYFIFLLLTAITMMNMLIGLLCDVIYRVSQEQTERNGIERMSAKLQAVLKAIDKDTDGLVSKSEFTEIISNELAVKALHDVGVDVEALVRDADFIFHEDDGRMGLPFEDFKQEVLKFRTSTCATNGTVAATQRFLRMSLEQIAEKLATLETLATQKTGLEGRPPPPLALSLPREPCSSSDQRIMQMTI